MFLRATTRKKDGKQHRYFSVVENKRVRGGRIVQRHVLYLGEINSSQEIAWRKSIEVLDEAKQADAGWPCSCGESCSWMSSGAVGCRRAARARAGTKCC
jgi:hypothetical protein